MRRSCRSCHRRSNEPAEGDRIQADLNSDLGESYGRWRLGDDAAVLDAVTSANVACGFHAGDPGTLRHTCSAAASRGVAIGAQVGYPDLVGFGRRFMDMEPQDLEDAVLYQMGALDAFARVAGSRVAYVKPHGALYNAVVGHDAQAAAVVRAARAYREGIPVLGLPGSSLLHHAAEAGLPVVREGFADRAYTPQGTLVSRREPGALLHDPEVVARQAVRMVTDGEVVALDGSVVSLTVDSICVHGDSPEAVAMARRVRSALEAEGVALRAFSA